MNAALFSNSGLCFLGGLDLLALGALSFDIIFDVVGLNINTSAAVLINQSLEQPYGRLLSLMLHPMVYNYGINAILAMEAKWNFCN